MTNTFGYMVIKVHFDMTLTFDLEDHICVLFLLCCIGRLCCRSYQT